MRKKLATATALAASLLLTRFMYGSAQSANMQAPLDVPNNVILVGKDGGGGMGGRGG